MRSITGELFALDRAIQFQFAELGGEHFLTDARQRFAQLRMPPRAGEKFAQYQHLPLAANDRQQPLHFTLDTLEIHVLIRHSKVPYCRDYKPWNVGAI